jgi:MFS family permease
VKRINGGVTVGNPFAALGHRSFRYYWVGMTISTIGTWMQNTAQPWLAYKLTDSPFLLGLVSALQFTPVLLFSLFAGVLIDRFKKKNLLYITQAASMLITLFLAILDSTGRIQYWHLIVTSTLIGFVNTVDMPARQSFIIELVGKEDLTNGIALNSASFNLARIVGPALAGLIMAQWGTASCFFINAFSFGAVIVGLVFVKPLHIRKESMNNQGIFANIGAGLKFIFSREVLFMPLVFLAVGATFAMNFNVLIPVFSDKVLHLSETGFGLLMSMAGVGALTGALTMATLSKGGIKKAFLFVFPMIAGALIIGIGLTSHAVLTGVAFAVTSFFYMIFMASVNSTMQLNATNEYRGRVMSVYTLVVAGSTPLGNLFAGAIAERFSVRAAFIACGAVILVLLLPLYVYRKRKLPHPEPNEIQTDRR